METYRRLLRAHLPDHEEATTSFAGEEGALAGQAALEGYRTVVAVGGDGTWSHVADSLLSAAGNPPRLGLLPAGTGNDFVRNLGLLPANPVDAVRRLVRGRTIRVDVGRVSSPSRSIVEPEGHGRPRHFLNVVGFGFDVAVLDVVAGSSCPRGAALYRLAALRQLFRFEGIPVSELSDADGRCHPESMLLLTVSNGKYFGGGFPIAPGASLSDGALHACLVGDGTALSRLRLFVAAQRGRHVASTMAQLRSSDRFSITFPEPPRLELDGDLCVSETATVRIEVRPSALEVVA